MTDRATIPGVAGAIGLVNDPLRGHVLTVDGRVAPREKADYLLPGIAGQPVRTQLKGRFMAEHPVLVVDGHEYTTGHPTSPFLLIIVFLPVLFVLIGNPLGILLAALGLLFNLWILRAPRAEAWKTGVVLGAFVATVLFVVFWTFFSSWIVSLIRH